MGDDEPAVGEVEEVFEGIAEVVEEVYGGVWAEGGEDGGRQGDFVVGVGVDGGGVEGEESLEGDGGLGGEVGFAGGAGAIRLGGVLRLGEVGEEVFEEVFEEGAGCRCRLWRLLSAHRFGLSFRFIVWLVFCRVGRFDGSVDALYAAVCFFAAEAGGAFFEVAVGAQSGKDG